MATTTNVSNLKINILTPEQYETATKDASQLYIIGNNTDYLTAATKEYIDNVVNEEELNNFLKTNLSVFLNSSILATFKSTE